MVTPEFRRLHDLLHQCVLSILSVWRVSIVYQTPCLCSDRTRVRTLPFGIKANEKHICMQHFKCASHRNFTAAREIGFVLDFALVHQRLRDCAHEAHVDSEAEAIVSIERRRLAQASQVLEQWFRHSRLTCRYRTSSWISGFNEPAPLPCMITQ